MDFNHFYHGTDARIVEMSNEERYRHKLDCVLVVRSLSAIFLPYRFEFDALRKLFDDYSDKRDFLNELLSTLRHIRSFINGNELYQYNCFYLTNDVSRAAEFAKASFAFGEIGSFAYTLIKAYRHLLDKPHLDCESSSAIKRVLAFAEAEPSPVVFEFSDIDRNDLLDERGNSIDWALLEELPKGFQINVRYLGPVDLKVKEARSVVTANNEM